MKYKSTKPLILASILAIICFIYVSFLRQDFLNFRGILSSTVLKYISILLCVLISLLTGKASQNPRDIALLQFGLMMTALADFCLLILNCIILGVVVFCVVQIIYCIRYIPDKLHSTIIYFTTTFLVIVLGFISSSIFIKGLDILMLVSLFYSVCLTTSVFRAIYACRNGLFPTPNKYLISFGMIFFLLCDINVALFNLPAILDSSSCILCNIADTSSSLIWLFYLPSQVMLALSGYDLKKTLYGGLYYGRK